MKKNSKRSLLLVFLVVFMCTSLAGCSTPTDVSDVQVSYNEQTITIYSPESTAFVLSIELEKNGEAYSWTSENLYIASDITQSYELKDLVGGYISENCQITSINVNPGSTTDWGLLLFLLLVLGLIIGFLVGIAAAEL